MMGLHFENCSSFGLSFRFQNCTINHSSFYKLNILKTFFKSCTIRETDFTEANLSGSVFQNCDLADTIFVNSNLESTDFSTSFNFLIDPEMNRMKKAKFSSSGLAGLLQKYKIEIV
jgi:uncharacterized protein YjbI with pentapeptide repeats